MERGKLALGVASRTHARIKLARLEYGKPD